MVAMIRDVAGEPIGIHQTYLDPDEPRKWTPPGRPAGQENPRPRQGRADPPGAIGDKLAVGEGIETTLRWYRRSAARRTSRSPAASRSTISGGWTGTLPHPTVKAKNGKPARYRNGDPDMAKPGMILPEGVRELILLGDGDSERLMTLGKIAAAARRHLNDGLAVSVHFAPKGKDWADEIGEDDMPPIEGAGAFLERIAPHFEPAAPADEQPPPPNGEDDYGVSAPALQAEDDPPPRIVCPTIFKGREPPRRRWIVQDWIPYEVVTGLYGDGGVGKSLLAQQLQTGTALGSIMARPFRRRGREPRRLLRGRRKELWRRQHDINASYGVDYDALGSKHWMPRLGEDNILMTFGRNGVGELTRFHRHVLTAALDLKARLVIIDTASDTFGGNENDRGQVRQFVQRALGQIALRIDGAVVCCAHPSRTGLSNGEGDGGSTGWSNAFRSRLFAREPEPNGETPDPDARLLQRRKANYASKIDEIRLRWFRGCFVSEDKADALGVGKLMAEAKAERVFTDLLAAFLAQGRDVSAHPSVTYAPAVFASHPSANGMTKKTFEARWSGSCPPAAFAS